MTYRHRIILAFLFMGIFFGCSNRDQQMEVLDNPAQSGSKYPYLSKTGNTVYMSWISGNGGNTHTLNYARFVDGDWSPVQSIARDSSWFVNWADFPSITANTDGLMATHWLNKMAGGPYAYDVNVAISKSSNRWSSPITPHRDSTATEHGFASIVPWDKNTFLAVWLDGRRTAGRSEDEYYNINKAMTLRGALISADGEIKKSFLIDDSVCDCCQTSLVKTEDGALVAYRNRTDEEIRDIYLSRFDGNNWTEPQAVFNDNWKIGACPVNGPKLAAEGSTVLLAWHTGADDDPTAKAAVSADGGTQFTDPIVLSKSTSLGRVDAALHNGKAYVSWLEKDPKNQEEANLQLAAFSAKTPAKRTLTIDQINSSRKTGFPQMEVVGDKLIFAWTEVDSTSSKIKTVGASLSTSF